MLQRLSKSKYAAFSRDDTSSAVGSVLTLQSGCEMRRRRRPWRFPVCVSFDSVVMVPEGGEIIIFALVSAQIDDGWIPAQIFSHLVCH